MFAQGSLGSDNSHGEGMQGFLLGFTKKQGEKGITPY
jgi:hypothetical protein